MEALKRFLTKDETKAFCLDHIFRAEGGFVDHPSDRGGPTNFGITLGTLIASRQGAQVVPSDIKNLTRQEAAKIYEARYWNTMRLDEVRSWRLAVVLFDFGVNSGPATAIKLLQTVLNDRFQEKLDLDGVIGPKTEVAIATANETRLVRHLIRAIQQRYVSICVNNPTQLAFLKGWLNRTYALQDLIGSV